MSAFGLDLPFDPGPGLESVISVSYRNGFGTRSAIVVMNYGRVVMCEHGERQAVPDYGMAFNLLRQPTFCAKCRSHAAATQPPPA